ncbi:DUF1844 domain-containing protein [Thermodesulfobacteriota bacterium]
MADEEKGFVLKDKRAFDDKGDLKEEDQEEQVVNQEQEDGKEEASGTVEEGQGQPLPEVNFSSLILSLSSSALLHIGEIADPHTGEKKKDLSLAKHSIDIIAMLKEKTEGNLSEEEQKLLDSVLTDLRWRYIKAAE